MRLSFTIHMLSRLVRQALFGETPNPVKSSRFPKFQVAPDAPTISAAKIQQIIDEEDLILAFGHGT